MNTPTGNAVAYRDIVRHPDAETTEGVVVLRVESGLYFANAETVRRRILQAAADADVWAVVLDAETTPFFDVTAAQCSPRSTRSWRREACDCSSPATSDSSATY